MMDERDFIEVFSELDEIMDITSIMMDLSEDKKKKRKKKKKYIKNIYGEFVECEDEYDYEYDILRYPPGSNPPSPDNKLILQSHYMIINQTN
jgi:hypothetical protein